MKILPTAFSAAFVLGAVLIAHRASSGPTGERLVSGKTTPQASALLAGDRGARFELRGGAIVDISPGSQFSFEPSLRVPLGKSGQRDTLTRVIRLSSGGVDVDLSGAKRDSAPIMVRGPGKLSSVTQAGVTTFVAAGERSTVACRSGDTLVGVGNEWKPLKEGFARTLAPEDPSARPRQILEPPVPGFDHGLVLVGEGETGSANATWQPVKDAKAYELTVSHSDPIGTASTSHEATTATSAQLRDLSPGTYSIVVAAVDKDGLRGAPSRSKSLRVAGVKTPEGAVGSEGTIMLGKDQRVHLIASDGLEVAYGSSQTFSVAPNTLGLAHNEAVVARMRAPGTTDETLIRLVPRGLTAQVQLSPRTAFWPRDTVTITVAFNDASRHPIQEGDIRLALTVNLEPVKVDWVRADHTLRATVPASTSEGPWVIRAEVRDKRGELLGRDFLEVAKNQSNDKFANR